MKANDAPREGATICDVDFPFRVCSVTETGPVREKNEDSMVHFDSPFGHVILVADGMGGHGHGDLAAALVVNGFQESLLNQDASSVSVLEAIHIACSVVNQRIIEIGESVQHAVIGSTVVLVVLTRREFYVAHVGDSRAYLIRNGSLTRLTKDHSVVQREIDDGFLSEEQARADSRASMLTRALGTPNGFEIEISRPLPLQDGDGILLSTDGLHGFALDRQIEDAVLCNKLDPQKVTRGLVNLAIGTYFSNDNVTVQFVQIGTPKPNQATRPVFGRPRAPAQAATPSSPIVALRPSPLWVRILLWLNGVIVLGVMGLSATHPSVVARLAQDLRRPIDHAAAATPAVRQGPDLHQPDNRNGLSAGAPLRVGVVVNDSTAPAGEILKIIREYGKMLPSPAHGTTHSFVLLFDTGTEFSGKNENHFYFDKKLSPKSIPREKLEGILELQQRHQVDAVLVLNKAGGVTDVPPPAPERLPESLQPEP
jgi:PPM family protein phosphatase